MRRDVSEHRSKTDYNDTEFKITVYTLMLKVIKKTI
jgi:hypothetical protein